MSSTPQINCGNYNTEPFVDSTNYEAYITEPFVDSTTEALQTLKAPSKAKLEDIHRVVHDLRDDGNNETNPLMKDIYNVLIKRMTNLEMDVMGNDQVLLLCSRCFK
mgnify:CR=1 FL=1|jgi:hypothetical protein